MLSFFMLQVIAMLTMTSDHVGRAFFPDGSPLWMLLTTIGRFAFLLYAFMIAEGYHHIKGDPKRVRAHVAKLALLAVISEVPHDLFRSGVPFDPLHQSVMPTLLLGLIGLVVTDRFRKDRPWLVIAYYYATAILSIILFLDYPLVGIPLIAFFGWFAETQREAPFTRRLAVLVLGITAYHLAYMWQVAGYGTWEMTLETMAYYWSRIPGHYLPMLLIAAYGGERGYRSRWFGWLYSAYYPLHLAVLGMVAPLA